MCLSLAITKVATTLPIQMKSEPTNAEADGTRLSSSSCISSMPVEAETREKQQGVAPWYYEQLAIVRRKQKKKKPRR